MFLVHWCVVSVLLIVVLANDVHSQDDPHFVQRDTIEPFILTDVDIIRYNIFDTTGGKTSFIGETMNSLHMVTRESAIRHEIFVKQGDTVTQAMLDQIENNLRKLRAFASIRFTVIPEEGEEEVPYPYAMLRVVTQDNWSTRASAVLSIGGGATVYGATLYETNLFGRAKQISFGAENSTINDRGWAFSGSFLDPNFYGTHFQIGGGVLLSQLNTIGSITMGRPYYSDQVSSAFNTGVGLFKGKEFFYFRGTPKNLVASPETQSTELSGWYGESSRGTKGDLFRWAVRMSYDRTRRDSFDVHRAFENTAGAFGGLFSLRRRYTLIKDVEFHGESLVPVGGMGAVTLGYIWPHSIGTDRVLYLGAEARQAVQLPGLYLYGAIQAGTGLAGKQAQYTMERFVGSTALPFGPGVFAARVEQTIVWNWPRYIFQPLDNLNELRGYTLYSLFGDNKLAFNLDYRLFPVVSLLGFKLGLVGFYDVGAVWKLGEPFAQTRFHNSAGLGLRIGSAAGRIGQGMFRFDLAYNFDERRVAQIIFSTDEAFSVFGALDYQPPGPYVP